MKSERRISKVRKVLSYRQPDLKVVLENIHDPHNVSAIFRTCDSVGVHEIYLIYSIEKFPHISKKSSASAYKWVKRKHFKTIDECYKRLRDDGFKIAATSLNEKSKLLWDCNFTKKIAVVFGNEHRGVSNEAFEKADYGIQIPMYGMVQSLNVSVSCGILLYEVARQRVLMGHYDKRKFNDIEYEILYNEWIKK